MSRLASIDFIPLVGVLGACLACACAGGAASEPTHPAETGDKHGDKHGAHGDKHGAHGDKHGPVGHRFERADEWTARFDNPERDAWQQPDKVIEVMDIAPGMTVADIGAGTGYFLPHLSAACGAEGTVLGLDVEPDMVRYMTERAAREQLGNVRARLVQAGDPGLAEGSVDRVLLVNTWHHISAREKYSARLASALRPGGAIVVVDYTMDSDRGPPRAHRLPPETVADELRGAGLQVTVLADALPKQYMVIARR
jgi:SAM-dependent methyltransferase